MQQVRVQRAKAPLRCGQSAAASADLENQLAPEMPRLTQAVRVGGLRQLVEFDLGRLDGAGGVAGFAIQFAKYLGARVITTCSAANVDYVRSLGPDQVIDYNAQDFATAVSGCDAVFDTVGGEVAQKSFAVLKPGGRAAFIASGVEAPRPTRSDVVSLRPPVERSRQAMERIAGLMETGAVRPSAIKLYSLSQAVEAHRLSESRHFRGKLVFQVR